MSVLSDISDLEAFGYFETGAPGEPAPQTPGRTAPCGIGARPPAGRPVAWSARRRPHPGSVARTADPIRA